jgi:transposase-like protein
VSGPRKRTKRRSYRRLHSWRKAKIHRVYDKAGIEAIYGISRNTVSNWIKQGLKPVDDTSPVLVRGEELNRFHLQRYLASKRPCRADEIYCLSCDRPKRPKESQARFTAQRAGVGSVRAVCPDCGHALIRYVNSKGLALMRVTIEVNASAVGAD